MTFDQEKQTGIIKSDMIIRILKGIYMFFMFAIFGSGILFVLVFIFPLLFIVEKIFGFNPVRMQNVFRFFFSIWEPVCVSVFDLGFSGCAQPCRLLFFQSAPQG